MLKKYNKWKSPDQNVKEQKKRRKWNKQIVKQSLSLNPHGWSSVQQCQAIQEDPLLQDTWGVQQSITWVEIVYCIFCAFALCRTLGEYSNPKPKFKLHCCSDESKHFLSFILKLCLSWFSKLDCLPQWDHCPHSCCSRNEDFPGSQRPPRSHLLPLSRERPD